MSSIQLGEFAKVIFDQVEELFMDEVGPVAPILCEEALRSWVNELEQNQQRPSLRNIHLYINKLSSELGDLDKRTAFVNRVYSIEALAPHKKLYKG